MQPMQSITALVHDDPYLKMTPEQRVSEVKRRHQSFFGKRAAPVMVAPQPIPRPKETLAPPIPDALMVVALDQIEKWRMPRSYVETIQRAVLVLFPDVTLQDLKSARRTKNIVHPRQLAMYLVKTLTPRTLPDIGRRFGGRDHTTVLHAIRKIDALRRSDPVLADQIALITARLSAETGEG
jgi:hypothetical protein